MIFEQSGASRDDLPRQLELSSLCTPRLEWLTHVARCWLCPIHIHRALARARIPSVVSVRVGIRPTIQSKHGPSSRDRQRGSYSQSLVPQLSGCASNFWDADSELYSLDRLRQPIEPLQTVPPLLGRSHLLLHLREDCHLAQLLRKRISSRKISPGLGSFLRPGLQSPLALCRSLRTQPDTPGIVAAHCS